jgi:hypothetical protein
LAVSGTLLPYIGGCRWCPWWCCCPWCDGFTCMIALMTSSGQVIIADIAPAPAPAAACSHAGGGDTIEKLATPR